MSMATFTKNVDRGLHKKAQSWTGPDQQRVPTQSYFAYEAEKEGIAPDQKELELYTERWRNHLQIHPHEFKRMEKLQEFCADAWAVEEVMKAAGCPTYGREAPTVEKAFLTNTTQVIFPFFYDVNIVAGILADPILDRLVVEIVPTNSGTADHAEMSETSWERGSSVAGEGTIATEVNIRATNRPITLLKFVSKAMASYEALRRQRLPIFARGIQRVGMQFQILLTDYAMDVLISGDGNSNSATTVATATSGSPVYSDAIKTQMDFTMGYHPKMIIAAGLAGKSLQNILNIVEFKDPFAFANVYARTGMLPTPIGMELVRWDSTGRVSGWDGTQIVMLDPSIALMGYQEGGLMTESDRLIDGQWERVVTSMWIGFAVWDKASRRVGTGWA